MKLALICFTKNGAETCVRLIKELSFLGHTCEGYVVEKFLNPYHEVNGLLPLKLSLSEWTQEQFSVKEGLIFIGAAGIAVRAIAPLLKSKCTDPAVVVLDDAGHFSISLLSGHLGGANGLAEETAKITGGIPVITTATDIHGRFAVDTFAKERGMWISDMSTAKEVSSDVLAGMPVGFFSDFPVEGGLPEGFTQKENCGRIVWLTVKRRPEEGCLLTLFQKEDTKVLRLVPKLVILGIGCRKGIEKERISSAVEGVLKQCNIDENSVAAISTIDLKKEEKGLLEYVGEKGLSFFSYPAKRLMRAKGTFSSSSFVKEVTGADNVCERAAVSLLEETGGGKLTVKKQADQGVTVAVAIRDWKVIL